MLNLNLVDWRLQQLVDDVEDAEDALKGIVFGKDARDIAYKKELEDALLKAKMELKDYQHALDVEKEFREDLAANSALIDAIGVDSEQKGDKKLIKIKHEAPVLSDNDEDLNIDEGIIDDDAVDSKVYKCSNCLQFFDVTYFDIHCLVCHKCLIEMLDV